MSLGQESGTAATKVSRAVVSPRLGQGGISLLSQAHKALARGSQSCLWTNQGGGLLLGRVSQQRGGVAWTVTPGRKVTGLEVVTGICEDLSRLTVTSPGVPPRGFRGPGVARIHIF